MFAYTDADLSTSAVDGDTAFGQLIGVSNTNAEIWQYDESGHRKLKVTGLGASSFFLQDFPYCGACGAEPILEKLNMPDLVADFPNQSPMSLLKPADITNVIQWNDIEIEAGQSREIALTKEFFIPEPSPAILVFAPPLLAGFWSSRRRSL